jgi:hypothetical protein
MRYDQSPLGWLLDAVVIVGFALLPFIAVGAGVAFIWWVA